MLVVALDLAITPMRVLQDPLLGPACRAMFEEGDVDDRLLMMLLLTVERLRKNSLWKPYVWLIVFYFGIQISDCVVSSNYGVVKNKSGTLICYQPLLETHFGLVMMNFKS